MATSFPLQIFYDGSCLVCASEMERYRTTNPQNRFIFIDISLPEFDARDHGRAQTEFMAKLHVCDADRVFYTGVDAFTAIWKAYPDGSFWRYLSFFINLPVVNLLSRFGYRLFARYRHLLPKRSVRCASGNCSLHH